MQRIIAIFGALALLWTAAPPGAAAPPKSDPYRGRQWGLDKIKAEQAWSTADGGGAVVAVVDTGVDFAHEDLADKVLYFPDADFVEPRGTCVMRSGKRFCRQDGAQDKDGHGTQVAGVAGAATRNGVGISGTAPGALILPVRVIAGGGKPGSVQAVADGITYAADKGTDVINLSLAYDASSDPFGDGTPIYEAIDYAWGKGAVVVVAAGNSSGSACAGPFDHPNILCVGATDPRDLRTFYSNADPIQSQDFLVAPGGAEVNCASNIFTTDLSTKGADQCSPGGYAAESGTSLAAPFVSGAAALLAGHGLTNDVIVDCLLRNADDLGAPGQDSIYGYGRLNAARAVNACI